MQKSVMHPFAGEPKRQGQPPREPRTGPGARRGSRCAGTARPARDARMGGDAAPLAPTKTAGWESPPFFKGWKSAYFWIVIRRRRIAAAPIRPSSPAVAGSGMTVAFNCRLSIRLLPLLDEAPLNV